MPVYKLDKLMEETRRLAAEFRESTGNTLPVSAELGKYDAMKLLGLVPPHEVERAVDAVRETPTGVEKLQVKSRVVFDEKKSGHRVGQLNLEGGWNSTLLVIMNDRYETKEIYELSREKILEVIQDPANLKKNARGAMSVNKFKAMGELRWPAPTKPLE